MLKASREIIVSSLVVLLLLVVTDIAGYALPLLLVYVLAAAMSAASTSGVGVTSDQLVLCVSSALLMSGRWVVNIQLNKRLNFEICRFLQRRMSTMSTIGMPLETVERFAARDVSMLVEHFASALGLVSIPLFLIAATTFSVACSLDGAGLASMVWLAFLPLSYLLGKCSAANYEVVLAIAAERIEQCARWLADGPILRQFGLTQPLAEISATLALERRRRDLDSALRGVDSYLVGFGRLVPLSILTWLGLTLPFNVTSGSAVWLAVPMLSAVLHLPRAFVSFRCVRTALGGLSRFSYEPLPNKAHRTNGSVNPPAAGRANDNKTDVAFDDTWPIWPGRIRDNLPGIDGQDMIALERMLKAARLIPELGCELGSVLDRRIARDGRNLSLGQHSRLQLVRAWLLARNTRAPLYVPASLPHVDLDAMQSFYAALKEDGNVVFEGFPTTAGLSSRLRQHSGEEILGSPSRKSRWKDVQVHSVLKTVLVDQKSTRAALRGAACAQFGLLRLFRLTFGGTALLCIPAVMLIYAPNFVNVSGGLALGLTFLYVIAGIGLATMAGWHIERCVRTPHAQHLLKGLGRVKEDALGVSLQIVSRDLTTVFERIAWYSQDIGWMTALMLTTLVLLIGEPGWIGAALGTAVLASLTMLYRFSSGWLLRTRVETVRGFDALIDAARSVHSISEARLTPMALRSAWLDERVVSATQSGFATYYRTHTRAIVARSVTTGICGVILDCALIGVVAVAYWGQLDSTIFMLAVTALLLIKGDASNAFLALTGLKSQALSVDRVVRFGCTGQSKVIQRGDAAFCIDAVSIERRIERRLVSHGQCYSLVGPSGCGKTRYLKLISGVSEPKEMIADEGSHSGQDCVPASSGVSCFYLNGMAFQRLFGSLAADAKPEALRRFLIWIDDIAEVSALILIDEVFTSLTVDETAGVFKQIADRLVGTPSTLIAVDHRTVFAKQLVLQ